MTLKINTNVAALTAHRNMLNTDTQMNQSLERLSTGLRINKAADDASGMAIADSLKAQHQGIGQGIQNANEGVSIVQIADGALEESISIVNTIKTKAIQAASDGQTADTRSAIQADIDKLLEELDTIAKNTSYNGQQLLNGGFSNKQLQVGADANQTATINIASTDSSQTGHISTATLGLDSENGGAVQLTITSAITGEEIELETIEILQNYSAENGMGALADEINTQTYLTGISATAVVQSTTDKAVQEGETGTDFTINGVNIGAVKVSNGDADAALVTAINDQTTETGVTAIREDDGALTLVSNDGRAILVTGDTGDVFGSQAGEDLSTFGHITLTQAGSSQFNIQGTVGGSIGDALTLTQDFETVKESRLAAGSTIEAGSNLAAGTMVGGDATVQTRVNNTLSEYELVKGATLGAGTVLAQGTTVGGMVTVAGNTEAGNEDTTALDQEMQVTEGSTLKAGSVLGAGTVVTSTFTDNGTTYMAGTALSADVTLTNDLAVSKEMTLSDSSEVAAGTSLAAGSVMGADMRIGITWDASADPGAALTGNTASDAAVTAASADLTGNAITLKAGTMLTDNSSLEIGAGVYNGPTLVHSTGTLKAGDTLGSDTLITISGDQTITEDLATTANGATLQQGSVIAKGSALGAQNVAQTDYDIVSMDNAGMTEDMVLGAGSELAAGSVLKAGSTLGNDTRVAKLETTMETELAGGSTLVSGSELAQGSVFDGMVTVDTVTKLENTMTLKSGSNLAQDTLFKAGTLINQDMVLNKATGGGPGTEVTVKAGTVLSEDLFVDAAEGITLSEGMTLEAGSTITAGSQLDIDTENAGDMTLANQESLTLADLSVMTQEDAQIAIEIADAALTDLDQTRSSLGSVQNQLTSTIANLSVTKTNVQSAESAIRNVDFAEETANFTRLQLLAQTSSYAMSQANASSQNVMSLLQ